MRHVAKGDIYAQLAEMIARDTTSMGMSPKARANRRKPTGRAKLNEAIVEQDNRGCRHDGCDGPVTAVVPILVWGRRAWRGYCSEHVQHHMDELRT